ncbi:MAG: thioredoxin family protein [Pseudomonadota bacterium]
MDDRSELCCSAAGTRRRRASPGALAVLAALLVACGSILVPARRGEAAAESGVRLIMIEEPGCAFCRRWRNEVEPGYVRSDEGQIAPLVHVLRDDPAAAQFPRIVYTPTFVLVRDGREIGRIVGYAGAELFWWQITPLIESLAKQ